MVSGSEDVKKVSDSSGLDLQEVVETLRTRVRNDSNLKCVDSDEFLLRFIKACDCDPMKSYELIKSYYQAKKDFPNEFVFKSPMHYENIISRLELGFVLRKGDCMGRPVLFLRFGNIDPAEESWSMLMQAATLTLESLSLEPDVQESGLCLVLDCTNFSLKIMKWATPFKLKALMKFFQESIPVRFDYLHIVNAPFSFKIFYSAVTPFIGAEFVDKLVWHKQPYRTLHTTVGRSNTPEHLNGTLHLNDMKNWYHDIILAKERTFQRMELI